MLTLSMTYKEMYESLAEDGQKINFFIQKQLPRTIKEFRREMRFPNCKYYEYTIPSTRNHYIVYFYVEMSNMVDNPVVGSFLYIFDGNKRYVIKGTASPYRHTENSELILLRQLHVFTYHFFQRYSERFLKKNNLTANEIVSIYLARNRVPVPIEVNDKINKKTAGFDGGNIAFKIRDGLCFARRDMQGDFNTDGDYEKDKVYAARFTYTTFLSSFEMKNLQNEEVKKQNAEVWEMVRRDIPKEGITLSFED